MPTYEYECKSCAYTFDAFQSMSDEPLKTCPQCGKELRRLINGGSGIIFKGSGFYVTDKKGSGSPSKAGGSPAGKPEKDGKPADSAPACPGCAAAAQTGSCPASAASGKAESA